MAKKKWKTLFEMTFDLDKPLNLNPVPRVNKKPKKKRKK